MEGTMSEPSIVDIIRVLIPADRLAMLDLLGFLAGSMVAFSGIPKVLQRVRQIRRGEGRFDEADLWRDSAQAVGNLLWVIVGASLGLMSVTTFCTMQAGLMATLVALNLRLRRNEGTTWRAARVAQLPPA
jgi:hypothetical protein